MGKRYYWLKLPEDFFGDKAIKRLRKIAGGDTYVIIYLKMMLRSLKDDGYLYYDGLEEDFPAELALDLDEEEDNVQVTLNFLLQHGKLEIRSEQEYFMPDMNIGSETAAAERKRAERERKRQQSLQSNEPETSGCDNVTGVSQMCHGEIDIDREIEKDIYLSIYLRWRIKRKSFNFSTISTTTNAIRGQMCKSFTAITANVDGKPRTVSRLQTGKAHWLIGARQTELVRASESRKPMFQRMQQPMRV